MYRLLKISFDQALLSLTPILSWFCLSLLVDRDLINVFTLTYPLQMLYGVIRSPFAVGANICRTRDKDKNAVMTGLILGIAATILVYGLALFHIDSYISFMSMDPAKYRLFTAYSIISLALQTVFSFILDKLYYEDQNTTANRYSLVFNLLSFAALIGTALLTRDQATIVLVASSAMLIYTFLVLIRHLDRFRFHLDLIKCLRYDSASFVSWATSFFVHFFGLSNALEFGPQYGLAITLAALSTDTQWDILESVSTLAKVDISKRRFNLKKSLRHAYRLLALLLASSSLLFFILYRFYDLDLSLALIFLSLEFVDFLFSPAYYIRTCFLQLNWSASKVTLNKFIARAGRMLLAFLPTPFCNNAGALFASVYQHFTTRYFLRRHFYLDKNGTIRRRPTRRTAPNYRYSDLPIDQSDD